MPYVLKSAGMKKVVFSLTITFGSWAHAEYNSFDSKGCSPNYVNFSEHLDIVTGIAAEREQTSYYEPSEWGGTMV